MSIEYNLQGTVIEHRYEMPSVRSVECVKAQMRCR